ncbi:MAG: hypothetical protein H7A44_03890 [Opitutaceae bacterium]|nr:hypothetical protein [Cephaloticoccus sp.]MCP5529561.1 hypothetical protein [Opitutaceae bacterium]
MKRFFLQRSNRERGLILVFGLIAVAWWGTSLASRGRDFFREWQSLKADAATQELWLQNRDSILARVSSAGRTLDPAQALDSAQSFAELNGMLRGLNAELGSQRTDRTEQFALHSVQVNIRQAGLAAILEFYEKLSTRAPYLGIDQCTLATDRANPALLNASFRIYSIEVVAPAK